MNDHEKYQQILKEYRRAKELHFEAPLSPEVKASIQKIFLLGSQLNKNINEVAAEINKDIDIS